MEIFSLIPLIYAKLMVYILAFTRITAFLNSFLIFRRWVIAQRTLISLTAILAIYVTLLDPSARALPEYSSAQLFFMMFVQSLLGIISAIILNITFEIFFATGQIISSQIGLSMASQFDPRFGSITALTHFYIISATLIFFGINGHLMLIKVILDSFQSVPLDQTLITRDGLSLIMDYSQAIFSDSVLLSIVVIMTALIVNIGLAFVCKFAPQFNFFSVGININLIIGLAVIFFTCQSFFNLVVPELEHSFQTILRFYKG